jgi:non-canonical purine NTP pyrophosphatase (RdgB/HAM1 family)
MTQQTQKYPTIVFATGNANKLKELIAIAPPELDFSHEKIDIDEIQSLDVKEIVEHKLREAYRQIGKPVIVEDVGAGLDSLNGLPGPFVKFFEQRLGAEALYIVQKVPNDKVTIRCIAGYYDGQTMLFGEGIVEGRITSPRGTNGFGFDSVVVPDGQPSGQERTYAEMTTEEKGHLSHRGKALRNLLTAISTDLSI